VYGVTDSAPDLRSRARRAEELPLGRRAGRANRSRTRPAGRPPGGDPGAGAPRLVGRAQPVGARPLRANGCERASPPRSSPRSSTRPPEAGSSCPCALCGGLGGCRSEWHCPSGRTGSRRSMPTSGLSGSPGLRSLFEGGGCSSPARILDVAFRVVRGRPGSRTRRWVPKSGFAWGPAIRDGGRRSPRAAARAVATVRASYAAGRSLGLSGCSSLRTGSRGEGSSLGSLASRCAVSQHPVVRGIEAEPPPPGAAAPARVGMPSALFGRVVISWESPGRPRPTRSPGRSSAGTAAMSPSPDSSSAERTGARPSPVLLVCSNRSRSPSPAWDAMAPCSGREGLPICICGQVALPGTREPPTECERAGTKVGPGNEGGRRCRRRCRRRMRRQARRPRLDLWRLGGLR
jgi:hypothetical protein